jgi:DNA polymerase-1
MGEIPERTFCTLTGAKLIDENLPSHSLKYLAQAWLRVPAKEIKKWEEVVGTSEFANYATNDAIWTYQLYQKEVPILKKEGLTYIAQIEMEFQKVIVDMEINGALIDCDKLRQFQEEVPALVDSLQVEMCELLGHRYGYNTNLLGNKELWTEVDFGSPQQMVKVAESLGFEIWERTKRSKKYPNGQPSFDKRTKNRLRGQHPFFDLYYRWSKLNHQTNNFIQPLDKFIDPDGRVRTSYQMVHTGRLSSSKPCLHNNPNPKKEKLEFNHREIFIPSEGNVLIKGDFSGQELRVLAEVSNDSNMLDAFNRNYDLHLFTANRVFNLGLSEQDFVDGSDAHREACAKYKQKRHQAKNGVNFPIIYGATPGRIAKDNKVSKKEAERWLDEFFRVYPGVKHSIDGIPKEMAKRGYVRTLFGRKRRFPNYPGKNKWDKAGQERQAFNMKIQGTSADIGKLAGIALRKMLPEYGAKLILYVHDEFLVEVSKDKSEACAKAVKQTMEGVVALKVRMPVDVKIITNFGE